MVDTVWKAAAYGDLPCLRALLAKEPKLAEARDEAGFSPLQWAALNDRVDVVDALLALRVDPNRCATARLVVPHALCDDCHGRAFILFFCSLLPCNTSAHPYISVSSYLSSAL